MSVTCFVKSFKSGICRSRVTFSVAKSTRGVIATISSNLPNSRTPPILGRSRAIEYDGSRALAISSADFTSSADSAPTTSVQPTTYKRAKRASFGKWRYTLNMRVAFLLLSTLLCAAAQEPGFVPLFDGKTLDGWDGDPRLWSVRDRAIVGSTDGVSISENSFLITKRDYSDF